MSEQQPWLYEVRGEEEGITAYDDFTLMGEHLPHVPSDQYVDFTLFPPGDEHPVHLDLGDEFQPLPPDPSFMGQVLYPDLRGQNSGPNDMHLIDYSKHDLGLTPGLSYQTSPSSWPSSQSYYTSSTQGSPFMTELMAPVPSYVLDNANAAAALVPIMCAGGAYSQPTSPLGLPHTLDQLDGPIDLQQRAPSNQQLQRRRSRNPIQCPVRGCPQANKRHRSRRDLNRHIWAKHEEYAVKHRIPEETDTCDVCGAEGRKDNIKRHMRLKHGIERP